jgi:LytS/YehU family sensor histidine kinase
VIKSYHWINLTLPRLAPRVLAGSVILGSLVYGAYFAASYFTGTMSEERLTIGNLLTGMFNMSSVVLLWSLIYFAVHYFENYKKAEIETLIWENAVKEFELRTLKSQLNPHFMFNAMNSIRALIKEDPQSAQTALTKLSNILRYTLKIERNETVPLEEEIESVSDYLALETIRFEERLTYKIDIDPSTAKIEIPPLMVQTLVENGIKHGISKRTEGGEIRIRSFRQNGNLHIQISSSGSFDPESLKQSSGFGIQNTKHRLSLLYGENGTFRISNENNNTVTAEVVIPSGGLNK